MTHKSPVLIAAHSFHSPKSLCVVCTVNAFNDTYYDLLDQQSVVEEARPRKQYAEDDTALHILDSNCGNSMYYLLTNLQNTDLPEFEAYTSIARNLIEKISRLTDVILIEGKKAEATEDFRNSYNDITHLFEATQPTATAKQMKRAKWLGRGTDRRNIKEDEYDLLYAYLSRVLHVSNMDTLLQSKEDRFFIKAYVLIKVGIIYHKYVARLPYLDSKSRAIHNRIYNDINCYWRSRGVTPEQLIYLTSFYDDVRPLKEKENFQMYTQALDHAFELFSKQKANVLPKIDIGE